MMRTRQSVCRAKKGYPDQAAAQRVAVRYGHCVRPYRCDRCFAWHLTSRLKGKRIPKPDGHTPR